MSAPVQLKAHKSGDYWLGLSSISIKVDGTPLNLTGATILLQFKKFVTDSAAALALTNIGDSPGIIVTDAEGGVFEVPARVITLKPSRYYWDIQVSVNNQPVTYATGSWQITQDVSR